MAELFLKLAQKNCAHVLDRILQKLDYFDLLALQEVDKFFNVLVLRYLSRLDVIWIPSSDYEHGALKQNCSRHRIASYATSKSLVYRQLMVNEGEYHESFVGCLPSEKRFDEDLNILVKSQKDSNVKYMLQYILDGKEINSLFDLKKDTKNSNYRKVKIDFNLLIKMDEIFMNNAEIKIILAHDGNQNRSKTSFKVDHPTGLLTIQDIAIPLKKWSNLSSRFVDFGKEPEPLFLDISDETRIDLRLMYKMTSSCLCNTFYSVCACHPTDIGISIAYADIILSEI